MAGGREAMQERMQRRQGGVGGPRGGGASWVLWLKTGLPVARAISTQWGRADVVSGGDRTPAPSTVSKKLELGSCVGMELRLFREAEAA